ncbi:polysaccharide deacetylase family protein [Halorubrum trueperi]|uniref:Polysaccharide deacetylase family protein n=1 Tax=Halorubrum trueperi TaxID=2004704 RepID=A0ABD5ULR1_9EURY
MNYQILDREAFLNTVRGDRLPREDDLVLTFDDGLADHHEHVLPELADRGLWGLFYVPAGPYLDDVVLDVHRTHALLGAHGGAAISEALTDIVTESMIPEEHREQFESVVYESQDNQTAVERAKRILNYYIDDGVRSDVLDALEVRLFDDPLQPEDIYLSESEIENLVDAGMHVGSHSVTHTVMSKLSPDDQQWELTKSFDFLSDLLGGLPIRSYCHPYGGAHSYTDETITLLENTGCLFGFDVDSRPITASVLQNERHRLPRYDCNEFRYGDATVSLG